MTQLYLLVGEHAFTSQQERFAFEQYCESSTLGSGLVYLVTLVQQVSVLGGDGVISLPKLVSVLLFGSLLETASGNREHLFPPPF